VRARGLEPPHLAALDPKFKTKKTMPDFAGLRDRFSMENALINILFYITILLLIPVNASFFTFYLFFISVKIIHFSFSF
jgi:hypothetical protein